MERRHMTERNKLDEKIDLVIMNLASQPPEDPVLFTIDDAEWGDIQSPSLPSPNPRQYDWHRNMTSVSEDGSLSTYTNPGFEDYQRQESNIHSPFDGDTVFLFKSPQKRKANIKKNLAAVWCSTCVFRLLQCLCCSCPLECSCRDQTGVHCLYRLKQKVLKKLKVVQCIFCVITVIQSGMVFFPLGNITSNFDGHCLLYSSIFIQRIGKNDTVTLDLTRSQFGNKDDCNFTTYINVVVAVVDIFFIWFFIHTSYVSGLEQTEMKLQLPFFLCYFTLLISVIASSFKITVGFNSWCYNIIVNNPSVQIKQGRFQCRDFETLKWSTDNRYNFYTHSVLAEVSTWLLALTLILQLSVNALHLYQNFKAAYDEIEVPHLKLHESKESSEDEGENWGSGDNLLLKDVTVAPLPTYIVEYKKHQVLSKVVMHRDKADFLKFDLKDNFILDKKKFRRHISNIEGFHGLRQRGKVDFPLKMEPGQRRRQNWTGSCEELHSGTEFEDQIRKHWAMRSNEWHGFDTGINDLVGNVWVGQSFDWHVDFGSISHKIWMPHSFEWPATDDDAGRDIDNQPDRSDLGGFESDFISGHQQTSTPPSRDWQTFDTNLENQTTGQLECVGQDTNEDNQIKDPWRVEESDNLSDRENNALNRNNEDIDCENISKIDIPSGFVDHFESDNR